MQKALRKTKGFGVVAFIALSMGVCAQKTAPQIPRDAITADPTPVRREGEKASPVWAKTDGYASADWGIFKAAASQTLIHLERGIAETEAKAGAAAPEYFRTRLKALTQQHSYLDGLLGKLDETAMKNRKSGMRYLFDQCVSAMEESLTQANEEADVVRELGAVGKSTTAEPDKPVPSVPVKE